jgi:hypothetical protein
MAVVAAAVREEGDEDNHKEKKENGEGPGLGNNSL